MKLFCGLPNETASTVVGILHIVSKFFELNIVILCLI